MPSDTRGAEPALSAVAPPNTSEGDWTEWKDLFDGKTLNGLTRLTKGPFAKTAAGSIRIENRQLVLKDRGFAGLGAIGPVPRTNYEVQVEAMRISGDGDFASLHFPVGEESCELLVGILNGGKIVGVGRIDGRPAENNETTHNITFQLNRWYSVRLRVTDDRLEAWIDSEKLIDLSRKGRGFTTWLNAGWDSPLAVYAFRGKAAIRSIRIRELKSDAGPGSAPAVAAPLAGGAAPPRTAQEPKWTKLFNGKDLNGWSVNGGDGRQWRVQRGVIVGESASAKTQAYILSDREYSDFSLRFDFLVPVNDARINGGVALRAVAGEKCPINDRVQIFDRPIIKLASPNRDPKDATGVAHWVSVAAPFTPPAVRPKISIGRWHHCEVTVKGDRCTAKFDGAQCVDLTLDTQSPRPFNFVPGLAREKGKVGFQINMGAIRFQKIEILDLSGDDASESESKTGAAPKFKAGSVWVDEAASRSLTVTARNGEKFTGRFLTGNSAIVRDVSGTIKEGKVSWLAKDVHTVRPVHGGPGDDNTGTIETDDGGDRIDFVWGPGDIVKGSYTLRLRKAD